MSQANFRQQPQTNAPSLTVMVFGLMLTVTLATCFWFFRAVSDPASWPILKVSVEGGFRHLNPDHLQVTVADHVDGGFFSVDVSRIREVLLNEPWIRDATIRRVWPDALHVSIIEQEPVARWGEFALLNEQADIFVPKPENLPHDLVRLHGPVGYEEEMLRQYRKMLEIFSDGALSPAAVEVSDRYAWEMTTATGQKIILGRAPVGERLRRLNLAYHAGLAHAWSNISRIDLRYPNGMAVSRHDEVASKFGDDATNSAVAASDGQG